MFYSNEEMPISNDDIHEPTDLKTLIGKDVHAKLNFVHTKLFFHHRKEKRNEYANN